MKKHFLYRTVLLAWTLAVTSIPVFSQAATSSTPQTVVKNFLYALYQTDQDPLVIAKQYIALQNSPNEFSVDVRYQGVAEHLAMLRKGQTVGQSTTDSGKPILFNPSINKILPYNDVHVPRLAVSLTQDQEKNMYVLTENEKPLRYFLVHGSKITSFDYMVKGTDGPAYFLGY